MASTDINLEIERPTSRVFRRAAIKRRQTSDGKFESSWLDISSFVKSWGSIDSAVDDVRLNRFTHSGINLRVRNDTGAFNHESSTFSLWSSFLTRYRTLLRIQAGYLQDDDAELPADPTQGVMVMDNEMPISADTNDIVIQASSLRSVFDEVRARDIAGLGATQTASDLIAKIRDHTDGSANFVFREFVTSTSWSIQATTQNYNFATSTSFAEDMTAWDLMEKLAETEGFVVFITRAGGVTFKNRNPNTTASQFSFYGLGFPRPNVIALLEYKEALNKYYSFFRLKWAEADTATSFVTAGTVTTVDPNNTSWKYGQRVYSFENQFFQTSSTAQTAVNSLFSALNEVKNEAALKTLFIPHVDILDRVALSYQTVDATNFVVWDAAVWDTDDWPAETQNFDFTDKQMKILSRRINLDDFSEAIHMREV